MHNGTFILIAGLFCIVSFGPTDSQDTKNKQKFQRCQCMEYWQCLRSGGNFSSYCGLTESDVCCKVPKDRGEVPRFNSLQSDCGKKGNDGGFVGFAEPTEWPWHAAILEKSNHIYICGASLIDENWILTAAHCVDSYTSDEGARLLTVRVGEYDITSNGERHRHEEYDLQRVVVHPDYDNNTLANDIALLRTRFPVTRRPNIDIVCIAKPGMQFESKRNCFVTGWGRRTETSKHSSVLKEVVVPIWPAVRCEHALTKHFGGRLSNSATVLCAGDEGSDACHGDGGGPLVCEDAGQWYQVGIVSFGLSCGKRDDPGIYTKLSKYETWLSKIIFNL